MDKIVLSEKMIADLRNCELDLLSEFIRVCNNNHLNYYLMYGSLLGAIRHSGFIPWDDDIDVVMPRWDYERLRAVGSDCFKKGYFFQIYETDKHYLNCYAKLRNVNTTFVETSVPNLKMNQGIFIDIFPMDYYYDESILTKIKRKIIEARVYEEADLKPKSIAKQLGGKISRFFFPRISTAINAREKIFSAAKDGEKYYLRSGDAHGYAGSKFIMPVEWFGEGQTVQFENVLCKVPYQYDLVLKHRYGDYMSLPPVEQRVLHHEVVKFDSRHGYKNEVGSSN